MIAIVDYGLGNVKAFANIFAELNLAHVIAQAPPTWRRRLTLILPGVGAFDQAMQRLERSGLRAALDELVVGRSLPVLGVCVGMQILMGRSEEGSEGRAWLAARRRRALPRARRRAAARAAHRLEHDRTDARASVVRRTGPGSRLLLPAFVPDFAASEQDTLATTDYGGAFACAAGRDNILGVQFHPEKSHGNGTQLLRNFARL